MTGDGSGEAKKKHMNTNTITETRRSSDSGTPAHANQKAPGTRTGLAQISFTRRRHNRSLDTWQLLTLLRSRAPDFFGKAEVVGKWVWIQFAEKQPPTITSRLAELGFHWNYARQTWQHPCGTMADERATYDPRRRYGSYFPASTQTA